MNIEKTIAFILSTVAYLDSLSPSGENFLYVEIVPQPDTSIYIEKPRVDDETFLVSVQIDRLGHPPKAAGITFNPDDPDLRSRLQSLLEEYFPVGCTL